jgi:beta-xylosidase
MPPNPLRYCRPPSPLADPYILLYDEVYYLYGTYVGNGFDVYTSNDLEYWTRASALALTNTNSYGESKYWAPEVYLCGERKEVLPVLFSGRTYLCRHLRFTAGPVCPRRTKAHPRRTGYRHTSVFFDEDGKAYLYFVRFNDGNVIWCAELEDNLKAIKEETLTQCLKAEDRWELIWPKVVEGPSVFKKDGTYYLMISANSYESQDYAVGFATSTSPYGPWKKYEGNPILRRYAELYGVGHGAPFIDKDGKSRYVFHAHNSATEIHPRKTYVVDMTRAKA